MNYTASNGVEIWRQKTPINLPEMTYFLIDKGADRYATECIWRQLYHLGPIKI
ncbi:hypothetical protein [Aquimarina sp. SS2-1]|uniref:hypothetical protein n=1 Tax=Aquimarina besae TaxID=3342247 RepID=UPI003670297E